MFVQVDDVRLYVDVEGAGVVPDGATMRQKPTLLLLHGGPASTTPFQAGLFGFRRHCAGRLMRDGTWIASRLPSPPLSRM